MGKFYRYALVMVGLLMLFYFGGLLPQSTTLELIDLMLNLDNFQNASFTVKLLGFVTGVGLVGTIFLGVISRSFELPVMALVVALFIPLLFDFVKQYSPVRRNNLHLL